jgi:hypothetical protein
MKFPQTMLNKVKSFQNPLPGIEIGIPMIIYENIFTHAHYGYDISNWKTNILLCAVGYFTYGTDRFFDSQTNSNLSQLSDSKKKLYTYINTNKHIIKTSLIYSYLGILFYLSQDQSTLPFNYLITSTLLYRDIKSSLGVFKSTYISIMWTAACVILPCILYEHNYNILNDYMTYIPAFLTLFSTSNIADVVDIQEDTENKINTLPVILGPQNTNVVSSVGLLLSIFIFANNPNFETNLIPNILFELQNVGVLFMLLKNSLDKK